ncbi:MAG: multicomponent Na+:H+ antiporter subunit B [Verrucomicrobiales bacterium]|jgi:multicomponent Na+:H+ antiporter subunit B
MMRALASFAVILTGALLLSATGDFPDWGAVDSPANSGELATHYIENVRTETEVPNIVTAVLADYRGFDTMFETVVVFVAGIAIIAVLRDFGNGKRGYPPALANNLPEEPDLIVIQTCKLVIPILQIFALYVLAHGHHSPGGGFQGGVMLGSSFILMALANGVEAAAKILTEGRVILLAATGIVIYAGTGLICMLLGQNFLDYHILSQILPTDPVMARSHAMLIVETGVAFTVTAIMFSIYANLATRGTLKGGL